MSLLPNEGKGEGKLKFCWGRKRPIGSSSACVYYESFTYDGVDYSLFDSVYLMRVGEREPYIGKLVNMWETASHEKKGKIVWFFRPGEIQWHLKGLKTQINEIFLASGEGLGLYNVNCLEAISGKCNIVCTSKDRRNPLASEEELTSADFIFHRTFNVDSCTILEQFPYVIAGHKVEHFFNRRRDQKAIPRSKPVRIFSERPPIPASSSKPEVYTTPPRVKEEQSRRSNESDIHPLKRRKFEDIDGESNVKPDKAPPLIVEKPKGTTGSHVEELMRRPSSKPEINTTPPRVKEEQSRRSNESDIHPLKSRKLENIYGEPNVKPDKAPPLIVEKSKGTTYCQAAELMRRPSSKPETDTTPPRVKDEQSRRSDESDIHRLKRRNSGGIYGEFNVEPDKAPPLLAEKRKGTTDSQVEELIRRPSVDSSSWFKQQDSSSWFKQQPWEERLRRAHIDGALVLLENLVPSYSSSEVEELISLAFSKEVSAKMIPWNTFSSPHYGRALVIFKSKNDADFAVSELNKKCLVLGNRRPVIGRKAPIGEQGCSSQYFGHIGIEKLKFQKQHADKRNAVSTSHCSQPNTIEYEMAIEWRVLQEKANTWWNALHKRQSKEITYLIETSGNKKQTTDATKKKTNYQ